MYLCTYSMYLCIIYPAFVASRFPRSVYTLKCFVYIFQYIDVLTCVIYMYNCTRLNSKDDWIYSCLP